MGERIENEGTAAPRRLIATYRLQLHQDCTFADAIARLPYLKALGVSHLYLSPVLQAAESSTHGYDLVDPSRLDESLGGRAGFDALSLAAKEHGLGIILDIVPNHMSTADPRNAWWWDLLTYGPASRYAHAFDVDWDAPEPALKDKVLLPVLPDHRFRVALKVARDGARFSVVTGGQSFPVAPRSLAPLLRDAAARCSNERLAFLADTFAAPDRPAEVLSLLGELLEQHPECAASVDAALLRLNDAPEALDAFLDAQCYRLAYWRMAERDLDYRRFFDVSHLVGLHTEDPRVFDALHGLVLELVKTGAVDGLRVDHVDGLASPEAYLERLSQLVPQASVHVEKILAPGEQLKAWPVEGTTGYDVIADLTALFVPPEAEVPLTRLQLELVGEERSFDEISLQAREQVLADVLGSEVNRLTQVLLALREKARELTDFSRHELKQLVCALAAAFPVYRTYVVAGVPVDAADAQVIEQALESARQHHRDLDGALFDFARDVLLGRRQGPLERRFVERLQQLTAPTMAKGVEDTALYRDVRLLALNEVGSNPGRFSLSADEFHRSNAIAQEKWPRRLLPLSTHDTKRSADARARLVALAWQPDRWAALARDFAGMTRGQLDPRMRTFALQTAIALWPVEPDRLAAVLLKSAREAKLETCWTRPNAEYERSLDAFARDTRLHPLLDRFVAELTPNARQISLAWTLLQCTCPGVPDLYQGNEVWRFDGVDPDNRRPVDWAALEGALSRPAPPLEDDALGLNRLHVLRRVLALRREQGEAFEGYAPLTLTGARRADALAFARGGGKVVVVVPLRHVDDWHDTAVELPSGEFDARLADDGAFSGYARLAAVFDPLPVALLVRR